MVYSNLGYQMQYNVCRELSNRWNLAPSMGDLGPLGRQAATTFYSISLEKTGFRYRAGVLILQFNLRPYPLGDTIMQPFAPDSTPFSLHIPCFIKALTTLMLAVSAGTLIFFPSMSLT